MIGTRTRLATLAALGAVGVFAATAGAAPASSSCGVVTAAGHPWIVVVKGVPCSTAAQVVRGLGARTAAVRAGTRVTVSTPLLRGFTCVLASRGKPGGSCSTPGAVKSVLWIVAA